LPKKNKGRNLLAEDNGASEPEFNQELFDQYTSLRTPFDSLRDVLVGMGNAGQNFASLATGGRAPRVDIQENIGPENPNELIQGIAEYAPYAIAAGPSLGYQTAAGGLY